MKHCRKGGERSGAREVNGSLGVPYRPLVYPGSRGEFSLSESESETAGAKPRAAADDLTKEIGTEESLEGGPSVRAWNGAVSFPVPDSLF